MFRKYEIVFLVILKLVLHIHNYGVRTKCSRSESPSISLKISRPGKSWKKAFVLKTLEKSWKWDIVVRTGTRILP